MCVGGLLLSFGTVLFVFSTPHRLPPVLRMLYPLLVILFCVCVVASFLVFAPFTYGFPSLSVEQIKWRHWIETWDLLFHMTASS